ncbi:MAG: pyruvate dehydrogenase (acetyl-transferring) E1 component subunit alpha [Myxococcales bacterium]|nr:pyruvate dehydrogenase (acetyl-transferring) E1 component subunit alpha [Myxococcales bacterium]
MDNRERRTTDTGSPPPDARRTGGDGRGASRAHERVPAPPRDRPALRVIGDDGRPDTERDPQLTDDEAVTIYRAMVRSRRVDARLLKLQRQGRVGFHVGHLGEEAAIIGAAAALEPRDWIVPCYREAGAALYRGFPLQDYVDHMFGNAGDFAHGRQMPDHFVSEPLHILSVSAPIGTQIPHAVGLAMAMKRAGRDEVAAVYFGDGATSSDGFHSAMNFAGVFKAPVVFLCRNNGYAISLPTARQCAAEALADKAVGYGMPALCCDGNDALAVVATVREAAAHAREGRGPTFVELLTYRLGAHSTSDDPTRYRDEAEVERWRARDPVVRMRAYLIERGAWTERDEASLVEAVDAEVREAVVAAEAKPKPALHEMFREVYEAQPWHLRDQERECLSVARTKEPA